MAFQSGGYVISTNEKPFTGQPEISPYTLEKIAIALGADVKPSGDKPSGTDTIIFHTSHGDKEVKASDIRSIHVFSPRTSPKEE